MDWVGMTRCSEVWDAFTLVVVVERLARTGVVGIDGFAAGGVGDGAWCVGRFCYSTVGSVGLVLRRDELTWARVMLDERLAAFRRAA